MVGWGVRGGVMAESRACRVCGKEFVPRNSRNLTCPKPECGDLARREKSRRDCRMRVERVRANRAPVPPKPCVVCKKPFVPYHRDNIQIRTVGENSAKTLIALMLAKIARSSRLSAGKAAERGRVC